MSEISDPYRSSLPHVQSLARRAKPVSPTTPFAAVCELLRVTPYQLLAVVDTTDESSALLTGPLLGIVSAKTISDQLLLASAKEGDWLRKYGTAADICAPISPYDCAVLTDSAAAVSVLFDRIGQDSAPVLESRERPFYLGMVSRTDLLRDLHRPFLPPQIGGMATPLGVYLTTGTVSGGVGTIALATTGFLTFSLHIAGIASLKMVEHTLHQYAPATFHALLLLPRPLAQTVPESFFALTQTTLFLAMLRQTPLAGYHAAEHQVVHAIERGEPLLPDVVRTMPRVHPRCSTNLVAGVLLFYLIGTALGGWLTDGTSYLVGALAAFLWWRPMGSFLQQYATTRPASDKQIESGIRAAKDLFAALDTPITQDVAQPIPAYKARFNRIWQAGFLQIFIGSGIAIALLWLLGMALPFCAPFFKTIWEG